MGESISLWLRLLAGDSWTNSLQKFFWRQPTSYTHNFISVNKNNSYWCRAWGWFPSVAEYSIVMHFRVPPCWFIGHMMLTQAGICVLMQSRHVSLVILLCAQKGKKKPMIKNCSIKSLTSFMHLSFYIFSSLMHSSFYIFSCQEKMDGYYEGGEKAKWKEGSMSKCIFFGINSPYSNTWCHQCGSGSEMAVGSTFGNSLAANLQ